MVDVKRLGLHYMGSKRKFALKYLRLMFCTLTPEERNKEIELYDVFGGGGSFSFQANTVNQITKIYYNDISEDIYATVRDVVKTKITPDDYAKKHIKNFLYTDKFNRKKRDYAFDKNKKSVLLNNNYFQNNKSKIVLSNKNYEELEIKLSKDRTTLVYLDPPYDGTEMYECGNSKKIETKENVFQHNSTRKEGCESNYKKVCEFGCRVNHNPLPCGCLGRHYTKDNIKNVFDSEKFLSWAKILSDKGAKVFLSECSNKNNFDVLYENVRKVRSYGKEITEYLLKI